MQYENVLYVYERYRGIFYFRDGKLEYQHDWYPQILSEVDYDIEKIMLEAGYRSLGRIDDILKSLCGLSEDAVLEEIRNRGKRSVKKREMRKEESKRRKEIDPELKEHIVGMKTEFFRIFEDGFSVTVLLKKTGEGHKQYLASHQKKLLSYTRSEIQNNRRIMEKVGDLRYYKPHKLLFHGTGEVEILFVLKDGIEKILTD